MAEVISMADVEAYARKLGVDLSSIDLDSLPLPPDNTFPLISDEQEEEEDVFDDIDTSFANIIIVDNVPVVPPVKFERLEHVVRNVYGRIGVTIKADGFWMPVNPVTQETLGYCFIEFNTRQEAELAKKETNGYKLDRRHTFLVTLLDEFDRFMNVPEELTPPEEKPNAGEENLQHWLTDEKARDQFVILVESDVEVYWNNIEQLKPELVHTLKIEGSVQWSPLGTYLATVHKQGVRLWGGATTFNHLIRCAHPEVKLSEFSPGEKYLVTYGSHAPPCLDNRQRAVVNIFDTKTGEVMWSFRPKAFDFATSGTGVPWPFLRWGGGKDDKYFATVVKNVLCVYETETFALIDKESLNIDNVTDFSWSPTDPIIATFVPEQDSGNQPARVILIHITSKEELRQKNLFSVSDCKMHWQSTGDYLAIQTDHYTRTKKGSRSAFYLFWLKERDIPVEVLVLENKDDKIISFAWEPKGHRFAIIHGNSVGPDISFYSMGHALKACCKVLKLTTLRDMKANALYWSPAGRFIILAGLESSFNGNFVFYDVNGLETMSVSEHYRASCVEWDPTGRYVATSVTSIHDLENGFNIWSYFGKLLNRIPRDHFFRLSWRPRPPSLLSAKEEEEILKNLGKLSKKYEDEDQDSFMFLSKQDHARKKMLMEEWDRWVLKWKQLHKEEGDYRQMLMKDGEANEEGYKTESEKETEEIEYDEVLDVVEEMVSRSSTTRFGL